MSEWEKAAQSSRRKSTASRTSAQGSRPISQVSRPTTPPLFRLYSAGYVDDVGHYHHKHEVEHDQDEADYREQQRQSALSADAMMRIGSRASGGAKGEEEYETEHEDYASSIDAASIKSDHEDGKDGKGGKDDKDKDLEKATPTDLTRKDTQQSKRDRDPDLVVWDSDEDPDNPRNWARKRRWAATLVVSAFTFISPVSSTIIAPATSTIAKEFGVTNEVVSNIMLSVFVLAYAIGPLFLGPLSEVFGRVPVLQLANAFYFVFNLAAGFAQNTGQMIAFRFLAGLGGSAPLSIGGGVISDLWNPEERGTAIAIYSLAPLIGPAAGPVAGGFITQYSTWRWAFWATSIVDAAIQLFGLLFLQETYAPRLLKRKCARLQKETGNQNLRTEFNSYESKISHKLKTSLSRPFVMLMTQPIVQLLAVYMAFIYGLVYLNITSFPTLWEQRYGESTSIGGLNYISLAVGYFIGSQTAGRVNDWTYKFLRRRNGGVGRPEYRCPVMIPGAILVPAGLFMYGWSAQARVHWIVPNIGAAIFSAGIICGFQSIQAYAVDSYTRYAASAIGAVSFLRSLAGFGFPLFTPYLYKALDYGWGNSLIAFVGILLGFPAPFILYYYGPKLRAKSTFAAGP